jgi:ERCC4-type nuclease
MEIVLKIDGREPEIIKSGLSDLGQIDALVVGDFVFEGKHDGIPRLIVERKSISDLICSIKDGRFREQRMRLLETNVKIIYIIEGNVISDKLVMGALENLALRHNICVIPTANETQTINVVKNLYNKIGQDYIQPATKYVTARRKNDIQLSPLEKMLVTVNGVSPSIAAAIAQHYSSVKDFVFALKENPNMLYGMELSTKRKLGPKLAERISHTFLN